MKEEDLRVVLFVKSPERIDYYRKEFSHPRLVYESVGEYKFARANRLFEFFKHYLIKNRTLSLYKKLVFKDSGNLFKFLGSHLVSIILANRLFRKIARFFDFWLAKDEIFSVFFEKYKPDLVFLANLFDEAEISLLREAKKRGVKTVGFVNSWDKITSKGFMRLLPDKLIVPNEIVKKEAEKYADMSASKIFVSGVPQYDFYFNSDDLQSREEFFGEIKADPKKPLLVYAPMGTAFSNSDWLVIDMMREITEKELNMPAELLVRFQPNDFFDKKEEFTKRPWMRFDLPGTRFGSVRGVDWDMSREELKHLKNTLYHMSVLVSYATSLSVDAACFDKPVININFEIQKGQPSLKTPTRRYDTEHYRKALASGGIRLALNRQELVEWIRKYINNPELNREGRKRLVEEQCFKTDGQAGRRIAECILTNLK